METLPSYKDKVFKTNDLTRVFDHIVLKDKDCEVIFDSLKQKFYKN